MTRKDRFIITDENMAIKPGNDILCKKCAYKDDSGFDKAVCKKYSNCKPLSILFNNGDCEFFKKDKEG